MDVRCERCSTEYELEDDSVSAEGTDVQCTTCGHTFRVRRGEGAGGTAGATESAGPTSGPQPVGVAPAAAEWLLETASGDGQVHRFRDLTSLQKWIIERKITRQDRISKTGQAWRKLGEIVELQPFFDVVDEADRAKAAAAEVAARGLTAQAAQARRTGQRRTPGGGLSVDSGSAPGVRRSTPAESGSSGARSSEILPVEAPGLEAEIDTAVVRIGRGGRWKVMVSLVVAGVIAYFGIKRLEQILVPPSVGVAAEVAPHRPDVTPLAPRSTAAAPAPAPAPASAPAPVAAAPASPPSPDPAEDIPAPAAATAPAPPPAPATAPPPPSPAPAARAPAARASASVAAKARAADDSERGSYDQLVSEGDKALENGASPKALRLFERALKVQPNGAEALAGLGYVNLDRNRAEAAVSYFRRALAVAPYAPAIFGMGEAYRALGDKARALEAYQRYLSTSPSGPDAPAARRQIKELTAETGEAPPPSQILREGAE